MKYSKIIKENFQNKFTYLVTILFSVTLFVLLCFGSINLHLITSWFSGGTNINEAEYSVIYYANMPEGVFTAVKFKIHGSHSTHIITDNEFGTPSGYEFIGWNTEGDGSGTMYQKGDVLNLVTNYVLYAQWESVSSINPDDDLDLPEEDDDNVDDELTDDNENSEGDNLVDNDTSNENGNTNDDSENNGTENNNTGDNVSNGGTGGSGTSGSGSGSSGAGGDSSNSGGSSSSGNTGSTNNSDNNEPSKPNNDSNNNYEENKEVIKNYYFKFYNKDILFSTTNCEVENNDTCMLVLPINEPDMTGYSFIGWSLTTLCDSDIITEAISVNSDNNYYSCYERNENIEKEDNNIIYYIISIWVISGVSIYFVIKKFKKNNINIDSD